MTKGNGAIQDRTLTDKELRAVEEYFVDFNKTAACRRAGYSNSNKKVEQTNAANVFARPAVAEAVRLRMGESEISKGEVLKRLAEHARGDIGDFLKEDGYGDLVVDLAGAKATGRSHLIKKITQKRTVREIGDSVITETTTALELYSSQTALELLGKNHGLFTDKIEVGGKDGAPIEHRVIIEYADTNTAT